MRSSLHCANFSSPHRIFRHHQLSRCRLTAMAKEASSSTFADTTASKKEKLDEMTQRYVLIYLFAPL